MKPQTVASFFLLLTSNLGSVAADTVPKLECALMCPADYDPTCSFDGIMYTRYTNPCVLGLANCHGVNSGKAALVQKACPTGQELCGNMYYCGRSQACVLDRVRTVNYCAAMCDAKEKNCKSTEVCILQEATTCLEAPCPTEQTCVPRITS